MTPSTQSTANPNIAFWSQFGEHLAIVTLTLGEEVGLAFLQGWLNRKFGAAAPPINGVPIA
jgi:hypothetical protein